MESKSLFNEHEAYTEEADELASGLDEDIKFYLKIWYNRGFKIREMETLMQAAVSARCAEFRVLKAIEKRRQLRKGEEASAR